jgi:hypothetical protein
VAVPPDPVHVSVYVVVTDGVTTCDQLRDFIPLHCDVFGLLDALHDVALEAFQDKFNDDHAKTVPVLDELNRIEGEGVVTLMVTD